MYPCIKTGRDGETVSGKKKVRIISDEHKGGEMTQKIRRNVFLIAALCLCPLLCLPGPASSEGRPNGILWISFDNMTKTIYMAGFFDGMHLGYNFSYWGFSQGGRQIGPCTEKVITSYSDYYRKYLSNVSIRQIVDGLDGLYEDSRNRPILIPDAVWLVVNGLAGMPKEELEKMIERWREQVTD